MVTMRFDDDTLVSIGISQEEIDCEKEAEARLNASVRDTICVDWAEEIRLLHKEKKSLEKSKKYAEKQLNEEGLSLTTGEKVGWRHVLRRAEQIYHSAWHSVMYENAITDDNDWQGVINELRRIKKSVDIARRHIEYYEQSIVDATAQIKSIESNIDWAKSEKTCVARINKWSAMTMAGCNLGDVVDGTRVPRGTKRPMLNKDGGKYNSLKR